MTSTTTSALDAGREDLRQRLFSDEENEDWPTRNLLSPLYDVADMVCRVGDHWDSSHYQADKAGDLVLDALRVRRAAFERYADTISDDFEKITGIVNDVEARVESIMWTFARSDRPIYRTQAADLHDAIRKLSLWADAVSQRAEPDPVD